jgi:hypothetical protein
MAEKDGQNYLAKAADFLSGIGLGIYTGDMGDDFAAAFATSPLNIPVDTTPMTNGNEYRKIFRF